jgi:hypothetical protein
MQQQMIIKFCLKLGKTVTKTYKMLETVCENEALSHTHVFNWLKDSMRDVVTLKMIEGVGKHSLLKIWKQ